MQFPRIENYFPTDLQCLNSSLELGYWLGRLWSLCSLILEELIHQVSRATSEYFSKPSKQEASLLKKETPSISNRKIKKKDPRDSVFDLIPLSLNERSPKARSPDVINPPSNSSKQTSEVGPISGNLPDNKPKEIEEALQNVQQSKAEETKDKAKFTKFKRRQKAKNTEILDPKAQSSSSSNPPKPVIPAKSGQVSTVKKSEPIYFDNDGKGNCQLFAILKGLEMQFPDLLKYKENGKIVDLTAQKLRQIGVDFATEQIERCGPYMSEFLGYLDSDRKEYNQAKSDPIEQKKRKEEEAIEKAFKSGRIKLSVYEQRKKAHHDKYSKLSQLLEKNGLIQTDEEFLKRLRKDGFQCSTLHLFALSIKLELPIYVKEQAGVKGHDIQMFNPLESNRAPIHLYRVAKRHYQYIFYPDESC